MTTRTIEELAEDLRQFIRMHAAGGCRVILEAENCYCALCELDRLVALACHAREAVVAATTDMVANGKTILDFYAVWLEQERASVLRLDRQNAALRAQLDKLMIEKHPTIVVGEPEETG